MTMSSADELDVIDDKFLMMMNHQLKLLMMRPWHNKVRMSLLQSMTRSNRSYQGNMFLEIQWSNKLETCFWKFPIE